MTEASDGKPPSERHQLATRIANWCIFNRYCNPYGGVVELIKNGRGAYYGFLISIPAVLDGEVRVYSMKHIRIILHGRLTGEWSGVVGSGEDAIKLLETLRAEGIEKAEKAVAVEVKQ